MYQKFKIICTICARGGSKGVPGKNIKSLAGKPMLAYSIDCARKAKIFDRIIVSTDDLKIKQVAEKLGLEIPFLRPKSLASDTSSRVSAVIHAVKKAEQLYQENYDIVVDLGNVAPFRTPEDVIGTVKMLIDTKASIAISGCVAHRNPYFNMVEKTKNGYVRVVKKLKTNLKRRQDAPQVYDMNDAVFAIWKKTLYQKKSFLLPKRVLYEMPAERSIDIDTLFDWQLAEYLIKQK